MSRLWPHPSYAEDQPFSRSILALHVLTRAGQTGALLGASIGTTIPLLRYFNILKAISTRSLTSSLLRSTGVGTAAATAFLAVGLPIQMWGKEDIEWKDRSWRLLENQGQMECDDLTYPAMAAGGVLAASRGRAMGWRGIVGGMGAGSVLGMVGYMGWRYVVHGGEREDTTV